MGERSGDRVGAQGLVGATALSLSGRHLTRDDQIASPTTFGWPAAGVVGGVSDVGATDTV